MTQAIDILTAQPKKTVLDADFIRECDEEIMNALLEIGKIQFANDFLDLYEGFELGYFITEMTE